MAPFAVGQQPAGAAVNQDNRTGQLTFVDYNRQVVTCTVSNSSSHDTSAHTARTFGTSSGGAASCRTDVLFFVTITAKDEGGRTRTATADGYNGIGQSVDHAYSGVRTSVYAYFNDCDFSASNSCSLEVTAAPK